MHITHFLSHTQLGEAGATHKEEVRHFQRMKVQVQICVYSYMSVRQEVGVIGILASRDQMHRYPRK